MTSALIRQGGQDAVHTQETPCEDTGRRQPSRSQAQGPGTDPLLTVLRRTQPCPHLDLGLSSLQNWETINVTLV